MKSLYRPEPIAIENLLRLALGRRLLEAVMLDIAFVALGFALIGLMGLYAAGLRQL
jgi:hypothetical protein